MQPDQINSCQELLVAWDNGESVFTVEMGGLGPGYEQAIHIVAFETLRYMLGNSPDWQQVEADQAEDKQWPDRYWDRYRDELDKVLFADGSPCKGLGLSGAQVSAATNIACMYLRQGYQDGLASAPEDRRIQVSKNFPHTSAA